MNQGSLFGPDQMVTNKPVGDRWETLRLVITAKAAPQPSATYGETVCIAGLRLDPANPGWIRLHPISFRDLETDRELEQYDVMTVQAKPARGDPRIESWYPNLSSIRIEQRLRCWAHRTAHIAPYVDGSMCDLLTAVRAYPPAGSLAAIRPAQVHDVEIAAHPGWRREEQAKIDQHVNQLDLFGTERRALEAPRLQGWYRYHCSHPRCRGHRQGILDGKFVALQRHLHESSDAGLRTALRSMFLDELCAPDRDVAFYVGNHRKRWHVFSVLGVYNPPR